MKIIKVGAVWCSGCVVMKPIRAEIEKENPWLETEYYDFDENPELVELYKLDGNIPYFVFLDNDGVVIEKINGEFSKDFLINKINEYKDR